MNSPFLCESCFEMVIIVSYSKTNAISWGNYENEKSELAHLAKNKRYSSNDENIKGSTHPLNSNPSLIAENLERVVFNKSLPKQKSNKDYLLSETHILQKKTLSEDFNSKKKISQNSQIRPSNSEKDRTSLSKSQNGMPEGKRAINIDDKNTIDPSQRLDYLEKEFCIAKKKMITPELSKFQKKSNQSDLKSSARFKKKSVQEVEALRRQPSHKPRTSKHIIKRLPVAISFISALGLLAVSIPSIKRFLSSNHKNPSITRKTHNNHSDKKNDIDSYLDLVNYEQSKKFLVEYLASNSVKEAKHFILPDPRINSALVKYWKPRTFEDITYTQGASTILPNNEGIMHPFSCRDSDNITYTYPVFHLKKEDRYYIGWRTAEQIEDLTVRDIISEKLVSVTKVRCLLVQEHYYNYGYDEKDWLSFNCYSPYNTLEKSYCLKVFLRRDSPNVKKIQNVLMHQSGFDILDKETPPHDYSAELVNLDPEKIKNFRKKYAVATNKPSARLVLEINFTNPDKGIAEITNFISAHAIEHLLKYQLPFIKESRVH